MLEQGRGKIITTASVLTFSGGILVPGYAASKGAVGQLTKAMANEWAAHNINVNAICPGITYTPMQELLVGQLCERESILDLGSPEELELFLGRVLDACSDEGIADISWSLSVER